MQVVKVAVAAATYAIDKAYDYLASRGEHVAPGMRVIVPFARANRRTEGIILSVTERSDVQKLKPIDCVLDEHPILDENQLKLLVWMQRRFFCTIYDAVHVILPTGLWYQISYHYTVLPTVNESVADLSADTQEIFAFLKEHNKAVDEKILYETFGKQKADLSLKKLLDLHFIERNAKEKRKVNDKTQKFVHLSIPKEEAEELARVKQKTAKKQAEVLAILATSGRISVKELSYFTGIATNSLQALEKAGVLEITSEEVFRRPKGTSRNTSDDKTLSKAQESVFLGLKALLDENRAQGALLYGVTGSGKTAVYLALVEAALKQGKTAIILVPEIALTPQLMGKFTQRFGENVAVLHSALGLGERYDEWKRIATGSVNVVVGTRSAIFAPLKNIGVIVIDEEQEHTYKSDAAPRYHAKDIAFFRAGQDNALVLLGSATPSIETAYGAKSGRYHSFSLEERYNKMSLPQVIIADMKENLKAGNASNISYELQDELAKNLQKGQQSILFLNRRGSATLLLCGECGYTFECADCSVNLIYHRANKRLMCHYCGHSATVPDACTDCGGALKHVGAGTQKIEEELNELFPKTKILRMDTDTIGPAFNHDALLAKFEKEEIPILIGTQMVTKGLDFPNVSLVGVISADQGLYLNDYRAQERSFSLITQVVGRAGRGLISGRAVIQTFTPDHEVIALAQKQDYHGFYQREITMRSMQMAPPFIDFLSIVATGQDEAAVLRCITSIRRAISEKLSEFGEDATLLGPAPAGVLKVNKRFRYQITLRAKQNKLIREYIAYILKKVPMMKEYRGVSVYADIDSAS